MEKLWQGKELNLENNFIQSGGLNHLEEILKVNLPLNKLNIAKNEIFAFEIETLVKNLLSNNNLTELNVENNLIGYMEL